MRHRVMQMYFIFRYLQLRFNAFFVKHFNFAPLLDTDRAALLGEIKNADILHIGGGGFLTGKTASRLYDNMFLIRLAQYLDTDVILTGHTLGVWQSRFQKILAKWGLKNVRYIGLRDNSASVNDLKEINRYDPDRVYPTFDDALFCGAADKSEIDAYLSANGMDPSRGYIVCNTHYWQVAPSRVNPALLQMAQALDHISRQHGYNIIFMPMHPSDNNALALTKHLMKEPSHIMKHRGNVRLAISAFQNAELCFTMKHHPIVFAMSAGIPTLSVAFEQYYNHKNRGALSLFNQQKFSILVGENDGEMIEMLEHLIDNRAEVSREIMGHMDKYREQEGEVMHRYLHDHKQV